jgi:hypothetical protein
LARKRLTVRADQTVQLRLKPTARQLRRIGGGRRGTTVTVAVRITLTLTGGRSVTRSAKIRLRT